jgi:hypothetical protein
MQEFVTADPQTTVDEAFDRQNHEQLHAGGEDDSSSAFSAVRLALGLAIALLLGGIGALTIDAMVPEVAGPKVQSTSPTDETELTEAPSSPVHNQPPATETEKAAAASPSVEREKELEASDVPQRDTLEQRAARERRRQREMDDLRKELAASPGHRNVDVANSPAPRATRPQATPIAVPRPEASAPGTATLSYWNAINVVIEQEEKMRAAPTDGITNSNAVEFIDRRIAAGTFAAEGLKTLPSTGVDAEAIALSGKLAAWYLKGVEICKKGKFLLEKADAKTRKGPQGKEWQKQDKEHQQSVAALNAQGEQARTRLAAKYRLTFPPLK